MTRLKVLLLTEEDSLYLPLSIDRILSRARHDIPAVCCLRNPTTDSAAQTLRRFLSAFGAGPLLKHALRSVLPALWDRVPALNRSRRHYSVQRVVVVQRRVVVMVVILFGVTAQIH